MRQLYLCVLCLTGATLLFLTFDIKDIYEYSNISKVSQYVFSKSGDDDLPLGEKTKSDNALLFPALHTTKADIEVNGHLIKIQVNHTYSEKPLQVSLLLHSHVDPGWLETFEEYYTGKVRNILNLAVDWLSKEKRLRFIWSETSFLERWWQSASEQQRENMKKLVASGRLEICGGAWVMTDEATPHFSASIENIIEGQQFIWKTFGIRPNTSWSVDPFGHGLLMPALLPLTGIHQMVVGRLNDMIKAKMRKAMTLRYQWKQPYSHETGTSVAPPFVNTLPYLYYTTRNGCGPDDHICCKYHVGPSASYCSNTVHSIKDVSQNANELLGQYRQTQKLYNTEHILITVGDDFYLTKDDDWKEVVQVYGQIADYLEKTPSLKATMRFSTVSEFFSRLGEESKNSPSLTGDFFPYTQNEKSPMTWWTGYFTHRPFYKRLGRVLEWKLNTFDLLNVLSGERLSHSGLSSARRDISLFQHHDAITGTSKKHVMQDYEKRLLQAYRQLSQEQATTLGALTHKASASLDSLDVVPTDESLQLPEDLVVTLSPGKKSTLLAFNPLTSSNQCKVRFLVNRDRLRVLDEKGKEVKAQIGVFFHPRQTTPARGVFEVIFLAEIAPLSAAEFIVEGADSPSSLLRRTEVYSSRPAAFPFKPISFLSSNALKNKRLQLQQGDDLNILLDGKPLNVSVDFSQEGDNGGAYVFEWSKNMQKVGPPGLTIIVDGEIEKKIITFYRNETMAQEVTLTVGSELLASSVDIRIFPSTPVATALFLDIHTQLFHNHHFSTDVNGLYMMKRTYNENKNLAANVFPSSTSSWIEDSLLRVSVHHCQPNGVVGTPNGSLRIMVDRVVNSDDGKGLPWGEHQDSHQPEVKVRLLFEWREPSVASVGCCHSISSHLALSSLLHPPQIFLHQTDESTSANRASSPPSMGKGGADLSSLYDAPPPSLSHWPCHLELVSLRVLSAGQAIAVLRRVVYDHSISSTISCSTDVSIAWRFLSSLSLRPLIHSNLSGTQLNGTASLDSFNNSISQPFSIVSLILTLNDSTFS